LTTVVATPDGMAADTQATGDCLYRVQKILRLPDGGVVGYCGTISRGYAGAKWLADGEVGDPPKIKGAYLLILRPDRSLWMVDGEFPAYPLLDKAAAIGAGAQAAMCALAAGKDAVAAVKEACRLDAYTSDPVQYLALEPKPKRRSRKK
jgi:hypothetical protein